MATWSGSETTASSGSGLIWGYWTTSGSATTTSCIDGYGTWSGWTSTDATTTTTSDVWCDWIDGSTLTLYVDESQIIVDNIQVNEVSEARRREIEGENKEREAKAKKLQDDKARAEARAKELLLDLIGEKELKVYERTGRVMVKGRKHDYIVSRGGTFVKRIEKDKIVDLCIHLEKHCPETDNVIALKLLAEADEKLLNKIANDHGSQDRPDELPECACG